MGSNGQQPLTDAQECGPISHGMQHQGQCLSGAPNSRVDRPGATVRLCASETHSQAGNRDSLKPSKEKPDPLCCSFEEPSFYGHCRPKEGCGGGG